MTLNGLRPQQADARWVAGVDGVPDGWLAVIADATTERHNRCCQVRRVKTLYQLFEEVSGLLIVAIDIPIGLIEAYERGGRTCDRVARKLLKERRSSVFPTPIRPTLAAATWEQACAISRASSDLALGLSKQTFGIIPKIKEIDDLLRNHLELRSRVYEVHPELCFWMLAKAPMCHAKKSAEGCAERRQLLQDTFDLPVLEALGAAVRAPAVDLLDAAVACWTALRLHSGTAVSYPEPFPLDSVGLPMAMWT